MRRKEKTASLQGKEKEGKKERKYVCLKERKKE